MSAEFSCSIEPAYPNTFIKFLAKLILFVEGCPASPIRILIFASTLVMLLVALLVVLFRKQRRKAMILQSQSSPPETEQPILKKQPERKERIALLGFAMLLVLISGTLYIRGAEKMKSAIKPKSSPFETKPTPTPTVVEANWKTYSNGEFGFQIDIPASNFYLKTVTEDGKRLVMLSNHPDFEENEYALVITIKPNMNSNFRPSSDPQIISLLDRVGYSRLNKNWDGKLRGNFLGDPPRGYYDVAFPNSETPEKDIIIRAQIHRIDELSESEGGSNGRLAKITSQMLATFRFLEVRRISQLNENRIDQIPHLTLPGDLEEAQLTEPQKIADTYYVKFLKGNMNFPVRSAVKRSGMLYANEGDAAWKIFYEIKDETSYSNNPYFFWNEGDQFYTVIVDSGGAGSGEGIGKLVRINKQTGSWQIVDCFYYVPESFTAHINSLSENVMLSQGVISYDKPFEQSTGKYSYDTTLKKFMINGRVEEACTAFDLER